MRVLALEGGSDGILRVARPAAPPIVAVHSRTPSIGANLPQSGSTTWAQGGQRVDERRWENRLN